MANLLEETLGILERFGYTERDVFWVGSKDIEIPLDNFWKIINIEYDDGYGAPKVPLNLVVVGKDWWLERREYDGSEWWEYKTMPARPQKKQEFNEMPFGNWTYLEETIEKYGKKNTFCRDCAFISKEASFCRKKNKEVGLFESCRDGIK